MTGTALQDLVQDCVVRHGAFLIDLVVQQEGHTTLVEVFVDAEDAITSDRCSSIGRDIAETIVRSLPDHID
jgi:ribosome maturation factor RimP